jgi:hypothetical protein
MVNKKEENCQHLELGKSLQKPGNQPTSENLSLNLINELMMLIKQINKDKISVESVNASCNAATAIHKLLKLNFEMMKDDF